MNRGITLGRKPFSLLAPGGIDLPPGERVDGAARAAAPCASLGALFSRICSAVLNCHVPPYYGPIQVPFLQTCGTGVPSLFTDGSLGLQDST